MALWVAATAALLPRPMVGDESPFVAKRLSRDFVLSLAAAPDVVFPLFGPKGEERWVRGWSPEFIRCDGDCNGEGTVFRTRDGDQQTIWLVRRFDAIARIAEMILVNPENRLTVLRIQVDGDAPGRSVARVTYEWTALTEAGNRAVDMHAGEAFDQYMELWQASMNAFLTTGRYLPDSHMLSGARAPAEAEGRSQR